MRFRAWLSRYLTLIPENLPWVPWAEVAAFSLGAVGLAWWLSPQDPTLAHATFPWLWMAPILIALRYGVAFGLVGSVVLIGNEAMAYRMGLLPSDFSAAPLFAGGVLVLLCGEFSDVWRDRHQRTEEAYLYVSERLARLTKRHLLLNLSHDRLEQEMLVRPGSLRDALARLRSLTLDPKAERGSFPGVQGLMQLLTQYVKIEAAALHRVKKVRGQPRLGERLAQVGEPADLASDDPLLKEVLETGQMWHIGSQEVALPRSSPHLVVAPVLAGEAEVIGVLAVTRMPFFSLNQENLQMLLVLLGYYADNLGSASGVLRVQLQLPGIPVLFAQEYVKLARLQRKLGIESQLVVLRFTGRNQKEIPGEFLRIKRGLDLYWQTFDRDTPVIVVLMPFTSAAAKEGFLARVEAWLLGRFSGNFSSLGIHYRVLGLDGPNPLAELKEAMFQA